MNNQTNQLIITQNYLSYIATNCTYYYKFLFIQITQDDFDKFDWIFGMDNDNIQDLNGLKPTESRAKVELLGSYDPSGEVIIRDPYYVCRLSIFTESENKMRMLNVFMIFLQDAGSAGFQKVYEQCLRSVTAFLNKYAN